VVLWPADTGFHALAPLAGFLLARRPPDPIATHSFDDGHETADSDWVHATSNLRQADRFAAGRVETTAPPASSTATHRATVGQEIPSSDCELWYRIAFQADDLPVGFTVDARPSPLPATHSDSDGQEISPPPRHDSKSVRFQCGLWTVGFRDHSTPCGPTATHSDDATHETPLNPIPLSS
jgi:hypothetical protein